MRQTILAPVQGNGINLSAPVRTAPEARPADAKVTLKYTSSPAGRQAQQFIFSLSDLVVR